MYEHYVYEVRLENEVIYVGSGKGDRYKHVTSGRSHNELLNVLTRQNIPVDVQIVKQGMTELTARVYEQELIDKYNPAYNKGKAANEEKKALHRELEEQIASLIESIDPEERILYIARAYYYLGKCTGNIKTLQLSFALSRSTPEGVVIFKQSDLNEFFKSYPPGVNKMFCIQCGVLIGDQPMYKTTVDSVLEMLQTINPPEYIGFLNRRQEDFEAFKRLLQISHYYE